jgi:hypothetical protein
MLVWLLNFWLFWLLVEIYQWTLNDGEYDVLLDGLESETGGMALCDGEGGYGLPRSGVGIPSSSGWSDIQPGGNALSEMTFGLFRCISDLRGAAVYFRLQAALLGAAVYFRLQAALLGVAVYFRLQYYTTHLCFWVTTFQDVSLDYWLQTFCVLYFSCANNII